MPCFSGKIGAEQDKKVEKGATLAVPIEVGTIKTCGWRADLKLEITKKT